MKSLLPHLFVILFSIESYCAPGQESYWVYVATSDHKHPSGIGIYEWNSVKGSLIPVKHDTAVSATSYLTIDAISSRLYTINGEGIQSFDIDPNSGGLSMINAVEHIHKGACYISLSNDNKFLLVAYYRSGSVASYAIDEDGSIGGMTSQKTHLGSSINKKRQESAHAHMIIPTPDGGLVFVTDLGMDEVRTYRLSASGRLSEPVSITNVNLGFGPRHLVFHPQQPYVYVLAELTGHVLAYRYDEKLGIIDKIDEDSILPVDFDGYNKSADIHISAEGQFLYASNRGANTLAIGKINAKDGSVTIVGNLDSGGDWPRAFEIDPSGKYLLVANKRSSTISVMQIERTTGKYQKTAEIKTSTAPQCIKFLKR